MAPERPGGETPEITSTSGDTLSTSPSDSSSTETAPREETVWEQLTRDRLEEVHQWVNRMIFSRIPPYSWIAKGLTNPKGLGTEDGPLRKIPYQKKLGKYNLYYGILEYFHWTAVLMMMLAATVPYEKGDDLDYLKTIFGYGMGNAVLAMHIAYNRRRVKRIIKAVKKRDERKEEKAEERERRRERNRRRKKERKR